MVSTLQGSIRRENVLPCDCDHEREKVITRYKPWPPRETKIEIGRKQIKIIKSKLFFFQEKNIPGSTREIAFFHQRQLNSQHEKERKKAALECG